MAAIDLKALLDDARAHDAALLGMLQSTDRQAMALFRIYVTLSIALTSAAVASIQGDLPMQGLTLTAAAGTSALLMTLGSYFCVRAMATAEVGLPGRRAEFWLWASDPAVTLDHALQTYLAQAKEVQDINHKVNAASGGALRIAKNMGIASVIAGAMVALVVWQAP